MRKATASKSALLEILAGPGGDFALFNDVETAVILDVKPPTLSQWRWRGCGPEFVRINRRNVRTTGWAIKKYLAENTVSSTVENQVA